MDAHEGPQTFEDLRAKTREIEKTARQLREAERMHDLISEISFERKLLRLIGVPDPGVF